MIDDEGSRRVDLRESYWRHASGGYYPDAELRRGEQLLLDCGLVEEQDGRLRLTPDLVEALEGTGNDGVTLVTARAFATLPTTALRGALPTSEDLSELVPDAAAREELLLALGRRYDNDRNSLIGEIGEDHVVDLVRAELRDLGHVELARGVRRVSLVSDQLGYDISAPRIAGVKRLLEVKTTASAEDGSALTYLSRNEHETGRRYPDDWFLVCCRVLNIQTRTAKIVGWCAHHQLAHLLPKDVEGGQWREAAIQIPDSILTPGLPRAGG